MEFGFKGDDLPEYFTRMQAVRRQVKNEGIEELPLVMDTKFASIAGIFRSAQQTATIPGPGILRTTVYLNRIII